MKNVEKDLRAKNKEASSALINAERQTGERQELMTLSRNAQGVGKSIKKTDIRRANTVKSVGILCVEEVENADVYNMEVLGTHCFAVNGGLIVHNCMDAMRYFVNSMYLYSKLYKENVPRGTILNLY